MEYDAGIVGYGPVGATLATLLAKHGLSVVVLERDAEPAAHPRAGHFDAEVMRVLQAAGIADALAPTLRVGVGMKFVSADGRLLLDWPRPQEIGAQGWYASYRFFQPTLERLLRAEFARLSPNPARLRCDTYALDEDADDVTVRFETSAAGCWNRCAAVTSSDATGAGRPCAASWVRPTRTSAATNAGWSSMSS